MPISVIVRFTDADNNLIDYYIETYTASVSATIWVEVPAIPFRRDYHTGLLRQFCRDCHHRQFKSTYVFLMI
jgi:hypothetical protein